jgi:hypothetical protein
MLFGLKAYEIYFFVLKILVAIQFFFVLIKKQTTTSVFYYVSDSLFKFSVGAFLALYFFVHKLPDINFTDRMVMTFGGTLLLFDALYINVPIILKKINVKSLDNIPFFRKE